MTIPVPVPKEITVYQLVKQNKLYFISHGTSTSNSMGAGFFWTLNEAEQYRTVAILSDKDPDSQYHIFELTLPNPAVK